MTKIDSVSSLSKSALRRITKSGSAGQLSFSSALGQLEEVDNLSGVTQTQSTNPLLFLQEVSEKVIAKERGEKILNTLESVRLKLLMGDVSDTDLMVLRKEVSLQNSNITDPGLKQIIEEIEQRANIELAKRGLI
ncbi:MAG: hypothetical protein KBB83_01455 [Alphaproteobacteria bacterium]|nr:hypothetical protein [Alphaproteobacteria bacterium]